VATSLRPVYTLAVALAAVAAAAAAPSKPAEPALPRHAEREARSVQPPARFVHVRSFEPFADALRLVADGRRTFRFDTFGDEVFWGDALRLHEALTQTTPRQALGLGLKVDADALPGRLVAQLRAGRVDLDDPATTLALLRLGAVVGVTGFFDSSGQLLSAGIQCALCHSTVDDSLAPGVGHRLDGWANRDLDIGRVIASAPNLSPFEQLLGVDADAVRGVLESWGPGKFDATLLLDGKTEGPNGDAAVLIPPAFGLAGVNLHTWTGWGSVPHWNALVANLEMGGQGTFVDHRLDDAGRFPIAAREGFSDVRRTPDRVTAKLPALHVYQMALKAPRPPAGSFDAAAAERGEALFEGRAKCATCHVPPLYTEPGHNLHAPAEVGIDAFQAERSPTQGYRTSPLRGLWTHAKGGYYHDGRFATLGEVVDHYDGFLGLALGEGEKADLIEFLKSL
jgi:hypothetical protein